MIAKLRECCEGGAGSGLDDIRRADECFESDSQDYAAHSVSPQMRTMPVHVARSNAKQGQKHAQSDSTAQSVGNCFVVPSTSLSLDVNYSVLINTVVWSVRFDQLLVCCSSTYGEPHMPSHLQKVGARALWSLRYCCLS